MADATQTTSPWRPIETAPRDGTKIDLWAGYMERVPDAKFHTVRGLWAYWGLNDFEQMDWVRLPLAPTHWMPIPEGPTDE